MRFFFKNKDKMPEISANPDTPRTGKQYDEKLIKHLTKCLKYGKVFAEDWDKSEFCIYNRHHMGLHKSIHINKNECFTNDCEGKFVFDITKDTMKEFYEEASKCAAKIREKKTLYWEKCHDKYVDNDSIYYYAGPGSNDFSHQQIKIPK